MAEPSFPSVVKCPSCGRTQGTPTSRSRFDCMFCGAPIDLGTVSERSAAPPPAAPPFSPSVFTPPVQRPAAPPAPPPAGSAARPQTPPASPPPSAWSSLERGGQDLSLPTGPSGQKNRVSERDGIPAGALPLPGLSYTTSSEGAFDPGSAQLLSYRWYDPRAVLDMLGPALYAAFLVFLFYLEFQEGQFGFNWMSLIIFGLLLINGLGATYRGLARLVNTSTLTLKGDTLVASHRPLPWMGARVNVGDIDRVEMEARVARGKRTAQSRGFYLVAVRKNGSRVTLIPGMRERAEAEKYAATLSSRLSLRS